ncbi:MAG: hypothetical protein RLZ37_671 [Actinomycetota bacterium]
MKKALIGMAAGAMALGASVVPVSAGYGSVDNIWDGITDDEFCDTTDDDIFESLVLTGGWAERLDTDGNGKPRYTVFQPKEVILAGLLDALGLEVSDLNSQPATVQAILADHIANGSFDENELEDTDLKRITMRSGFVASVSGTGDNMAIPRTIYGNVYVAGSLIVAGGQHDNGWLYCLMGIIDSTPQEAHEGLNSEDTPNDGTPGGTNSLPDTL